MSAGAPASGPTRSERLDDAVHAITELHKRFKDRLTLDNPRFVDRYIEGKLNLVVRFSVRLVKEEFFALFQREEILLHFADHEGADIEALKCGPDCHNQAVFVDIVQAMEGPEIGPIASRVWFDRFERIHRILPHSLYFSRKAGFEIFGARRDEKTCLVPVAFGAPDTHEIVDEASRIRIALGSNFVWLGIEESLDRRLEIIDMFVGPFNF